jgi:membrane-bound lytic murein transglycosylase A
MNLLRLVRALPLLLLAACAAQPPVRPPEQHPPAEVAEERASYRAVAWDDVAGWREDRLDDAWDAFLKSCRAIGQQAAWRSVCADAVALPAGAGARAFFENRFTPYQVLGADGRDSGLVTGYYEPLLDASREKSARFRYPLYAPPDDLLTIDLASVYPQLKSMRLRGRLEGKRVVPYYSRAEIENGVPALEGKALFWVDDAVASFFLEIQGSGRLRLPDGRLARVGYADQNGHPYRSIGKRLVESGELSLDQASMQGIQAWAKKNPGKLKALLDSNPSYVFFRELPGGEDGPPGALGQPLTAGRSIAVDPRAIPLGAPVFLATTWPNSARPLNRLVLAQDTGGAIRGAIRADFFWGFGTDAARQAGAMKQDGRMWLLWPKTEAPPQGGE